ncbi:MAG: hypothetical protein HW421_3845 [Ignavibacteria bacterium]|nr:hypothetical protein [Ignavibacteria bacterium]
MLSSFIEMSFVSEVKNLLNFEQILPTERNNCCLDVSLCTL